MKPGAKSADAIERLAELNAVLRLKVAAREILGAGKGHEGRLPADGRAVPSVSRRRGRAPNRHRARAPGRRLRRDGDRDGGRPRSRTRLE